jgi:signal transduction histidine kinase/CheY-like chemotaxis protein
MLFRLPRTSRRTHAFVELLPLWARSVGLALAVGAAYFLAARLSLALLSKPDGVAVFWPAAGVAAGALICLGSAARLPVMAGVIAATIVANLLGDRNFWSAAVFAACNAGEAVLVAALIDRFFGSPFSLNSLRHVLGFLAVSFVGTAVSGIGGTLGYWLFHTSTAPALTIWYHWFASDAVGIITVAPLLIELSAAAREPPPRNDVIEGVFALAALAVLIGFVVHWPSEAWAVEVTIALLFPILLWIGARCTPLFAATATFIFSLSIVWTTTFGIGAFGNPNLSSAERVLSAQFSILVQSLCALVLAALFAERRRHVAVLIDREVRLRDALKAAQNADRAKTGFLTAASHDLRQPLQTLNLLQAALKPRLADSESRSLLAGIERSVDVMNGMLISLLDINRIEAGTLRPSITEFPVSDLFDSLATDFLKPIIEKGLEWRLVQSEIWIKSDRRILDEMIRNLLSNAVRYTDHGRILVGCRRAGDKARIEVWDSGVGIMGGQIPRIFEEHYQVPGSAQLGGFGLGLAIVQRLAKILDHQVDVRSTPGKGSGFSIEVPLVGKPEFAGRSSEQSENDQDWVVSGTVLIIEDESTVRASLVSLLRSYGLNAVSAATAEEALAVVATRNVAPDLLLTDYNLPGQMNGIESVRALRGTLDRDIPAIVMTGDTRKEVIEAIAARNLGVAVKPVNADDLLRMITGLLDGPPKAAASAPRPSSRAS